MIGCTPRRMTAAPGFRCRNCTGSPASGGSAPLRRISSARRPTAATASPSRPTRRKSLRDAGRMEWMPPCWSRTARFATRRVSLVARHLEANGISTVIMGCAKDIVEHAASAAFLVFRFPARQFGWQAARPRLAGFHAGTRFASAGIGAGGANHSAVAAALERGCFMEARLLQCRDHRAPRNWRGDGANLTHRRPSRADCERAPPRNRLLSPPQSIYVNAAFNEPGSSVGRQAR